MSVGAVEESGPIVRIAVIIRVVGRRLSQWEAVWLCCVLRLVIPVSIAVGVLPLGRVKGPYISAVFRSVPLENGALVGRVARTITVAVQTAVSVPEGHAVVPRAIITVDGVRVVVAVAITVVITVLRSEVWEKIAVVGVRVESGRTTVDAVVVPKSVTVGIDGLFPIGVEFVAADVTQQVVGPTVLVAVLTAVAVNPGRSTLVVTTVYFVPETVRVKIIAALGYKGGKSRICRAGVGQGTQRIVTVGIAVAVHPLVANGRHAVDDVEDKVPVSIGVEAEENNVVIGLVPVRHVHRTVAVHRRMNGFLSDDVAKPNGHPRRRGPVFGGQVKSVEHQVMTCRVAGEEHQMAAGVNDVPRTLQRGGWPFCKRCPDP